jgi:hypothetical protein
LRKIGTRSGRHKLSDPLAFGFFSGIAVTRVRPPLYPGPSNVD